MSEEIKQEEVSMENLEKSVEKPAEPYRFGGTYTPKMDDKGRFFVPAKFLEYMNADGGCFITMGFDGCLWMFCKAEWNKIAAHLENNLSSLKKKERRLIRFLLGNSKECELDKQGRILIPQDLRRNAGITDSLIAIGVGNKIELWAANVLNNTDEPDEDFESIEDIAEEIEGLSL